MLDDDRPILLATNNAHKVEEIRALFETAGIAVESLSEAGVELPEPVEDQPTFSGNAARKARHYARGTGRLCLADDSGLIVDALEGAPGVRSARFAGVTGSRAEVDAANNRKLIEQLKPLPPNQRSARFVCVMALASDRGVLAEVTGSVKGHIVLEPRGHNGFGYDPHFVVDELGRTAAELCPDQKNAISHRGRAARKMLATLQAGLNPLP
jgi:XTP/dITP diphosphohydrolase